MAMPGKVHAVGQLTQVVYGRLGGESAASGLNFMGLFEEGIEIVFAMQNIELRNIRASCSCYCFLRVDIQTTRPTVILADRLM